MSKMIRKSRDGCKKKPELEIDCDGESISAEVAASARLVLGRYDKQLHAKLAREKPGHTCTKCGRPMKGHSAGTCPNCLDDRSNPEYKKICDCKAFYKKFPHCDDISELRKQEDMQKRIPFEDLPPEYARLFHQTQSLILPFEHLKDYFCKTVVFDTKMQMEHSSRYDYKPARTIRVMWASARKHQLMALKCVIWPLCTRRPVSELEWQNSEREMYQQTQVEQDDIMRGKLPLRIAQADELTITPETSPRSIACFLESCFSSTMKSNIPLHNKLIMWAIAKAPRFVERYFALVRQLQNKNDQMTFNWDQFRQPVLELQDSDELQFGPTIEPPRSPLSGQKATFLPVKVDAESQVEVQTRCVEVQTDALPQPAMEPQSTSDFGACVETQADTGMTEADGNHKRASPSHMCAPAAKRVCGEEAPCVAR